MQEGSIQFSEVQSLYELCTFSTDLKKFCSDIGVSYEKYLKWRSRQRWSEEKQRMVEMEEPAKDVMSEVLVTDMPDDEADSDESDDGAECDSVQQQVIQEHTSADADGTPQVKGFDLKKTTLADVICAGRGLDARVDSLKMRMHDGLNIRHINVTLRDIIITLHQLNIMYSC